ncbi:Phosphoglycerate mutase family 2 [Streptococcus oralis]|uniref:Phosphoglycerate mutase family 2 n=1 Tax=Streptococcus oralis TaxID=1303 RepID=A0A139P4C5_STROR|nr:Phosphoglycerate mutase family 2 [Streptococcus oralis]
MKNTYILLRHAHSVFSSDDVNRNLSEKVFASLAQLDFLNLYTIDYCVSSPYKHAFETVNSSPVIVLDERLRERKLSSKVIKDAEFQDTINYLW